MKRLQRFAWIFIVLACCSKEKPITPRPTKPRLVAAPVEEQVEEPVTPNVEVEPSIPELISRCEKSRLAYRDSKPIRWNTLKTIKKNVEWNPGKPQKLNIETKKDDPEMEFGCRVMLDDEIIAECEGKNPRYAEIGGLFFLTEQDEYGAGGTYIYEAKRDIDTFIPGIARLGTNNTQFVFEDNKNSLGLKTVEAATLDEIFSEHPPEFPCVLKTRPIFKVATLEIEPRLNHKEETREPTTVSTKEPGFEIIGCFDTILCLLRSKAKAGFHTVEPQELKNPAALELEIYGELEAN